MCVKLSTSLNWLSKITTETKVLQLVLLYSNATQSVSKIRIILTITHFTCESSTQLVLLTFILIIIFLCV